MRLENLYPDFSSAHPSQQESQVISYRLRRAEDMLKTPTWPKPKKKSKAKAKKKPAVLTADEKVLMALLGLKKKEVIAMRGIKKC